MNKFDNKCVSAYEEASYILEKYGYIKNTNGRLYWCGDLK
jgi:hypothetical protein